jgi:hypothetical protein
VRAANPGISCGHWALLQDVGWRFGPVHVGRSKCAYPVRASNIRKREVNAWNTGWMRSQALPNHGGTQSPRSLLVFFLRNCRGKLR